ncbi:MAG: ATP-dependent zinc metalloprotease FtsH [Balneolaceae bacterium]|nr:ATP-dependent zinc metalloprotease FtsH [Balneolaceae bacterium]
MAKQNNSQNKNKKNKNPLKEKGERNSPKFPSWIYLVLFAVLIGIQFYFMSSDTGNRIKYSTFLEYVQEGYIEQIVITNGTNITGEYSEKAIQEGIVQQNSSENQLPFGDSSPSKKFNTTMLEGDEIRPLLDQNEVVYDAQIQEDWFSGIFIWLLILGLAVAFWVFVFRRMNPGQQVLNIGKNKASLYDKQKENKVSFKDVAGLNEAKAEVEEVVEFLKNPKKFTRLGGTLPKGVLLVGPPGTGKTLLAKATAGEADVPFFSLSGSDFVEMFVGVGAARVRDLFKQAKEKAPCIIFIDEIDAIGRSRGKGMMMGSNDERENTLNQLLSEMDGFNTDNGVIIMAATNRPDVLDTALLRPGRFDRQILIDKPDLNGRVSVLEVHSRNLKLSDDIDLKLLASQTPGFAGAELANLCNEAALMAARRGKKAVEMEDFQDSIERVIAGLEKKNKLISPKEREIVAYHESGHAIIGWYLEHTDPVLKVSIVPRGLAALGYTLQTPLEDRFLMTTEELNDKICALLGGRVAEEIIFGRISTGAQNDLERITNLAFAMVAEYGMSEELGYLSLKDSQNPENSYGFNKKYSDETSRRIDKAVAQIIQENYKRTKELLTKHKDQLKNMAETLLEKEVLDHNDLRDLLGDHPEGKYPEGIFNDRSGQSKVNGKPKKEIAQSSDTDSKSNDESALDSSN